MTSPYLIQQIKLDNALRELDTAITELLNTDPKRLVGDIEYIDSGILALKLIRRRIDELQVVQAAE